MKPILTFATLILSVRALGQAAIQFTNYLPPWIDAPVFDSDCVSRLVGNAYLCQVYGGLTPESLVSMGQVLPFNTPPATGLGGYMANQSGGSFAQGGLVYVQLRAWQASAGETYEAAVASGGKYGYSNIVPMPAIVGPGSPTYPFGLQSFCLFSALPPELSAGAVDGKNGVVLTWTVPSDGFLLQQNSHLSSTNWVTVTNAVSVAGTNQFKVSAAAGTVFYRLIHPEQLQ